MSCGLPVVACRTGGLPEVVEDGVCGILVGIGDTAAAVGAGLSLLKDGDMWQSFSQRGQEIAREKFSLGRIVPLYESYFEKVMAL
jgi:glycosyltransferase involved in cell wall biosynthesis